MGLDDLFESIVDFFSNINDVFSNLLDAGDTPLSHWGYWLGLILYLAGLWYLPEQMGMVGYSLRDKVLGTIIFPVIEYVIFKKFMD